MNIINKTQRQSVFQKMGGQIMVNNIIDLFYIHMLADYRVSRFFNTEDEKKQKTALKTLITATCTGVNIAEEKFKALLDDFFLLAFARNKRKSFVSGSDFGFLSLIIEQDHPQTHLLSEAHAALLKFMPDDFHYDIVIEHVTTSVQELNINNNLIKEILEIVEGARTCVLGR